MVSGVSGVCEGVCFSVLCVCVHVLCVFMWCVCVCACVHVVCVCVFMLCVHHKVGRIFDKLADFQLAELLVSAILDPIPQSDQSLRLSPTREQNTRMKML